MYAIEVEQLRKVFGDVEAVAGIDLTVAEGEVFGFLGPNGAGKSTTTRILTTLLQPTSGTARVAGFDLFEEPHKIRLSIGSRSKRQRSIACNGARAVGLARAPAGLRPSRPRALHYWLQ